MAILAGDGLLNYAYEVMLKNARKYPDNVDAHLNAMLEVATSAGIYGMISGQAGDLENEGKKLSAQDVYFVHRRKTDVYKRQVLIHYRLAICCAGTTDTGENYDTIWSGRKFGRILPAGIQAHGGCAGVDRKNGFKCF